MKSKRQAKILELIARFEIETQEELAARLNDAGFSVTQATVSRDIRELNLSKVAGHRGKQKYAAIERHEKKNSDKYTRVLKEGYMSKAVATHMIVIKTVSGMAMAVAAAIDNLNISGIVGCIAGDDTIMCAIHSAEDAGKVMEAIDRMLKDF